VRKEADAALIHIEAGTLLDKVQGKDTVERLTALKALGDMGHAAEWGELIISRCLTDSNEEIRCATADALKKIKR
jgi:HEAT repeat protein